MFLKKLNFRSWHSTVQFYFLAFFVIFILLLVCVCLGVLRSFRSRIRSCWLLFVSSAATRRRAKRKPATASLSLIVRLYYAVSQKYVPNSAHISSELHGWIMIIFGSKMRIVFKIMCMFQFLPSLNFFLTSLLLFGSN